MAAAKSAAAIKRAVAIGTNLQPIAISAPEEKIFASVSDT